MPKIDWFDDDLYQPRWEPRRRPDRLARIWTSPLARDRRDAVPPVSPPVPPETIASTRRPLHLIWGPPQPRAPD
ncbi:MAG: hypothetical protein JOZ81_06255 [Chloroflexi bacterium]|nr:hypothetical protein [Chloroflexota bacterium]